MNQPNGCRLRQAQKLDRDCSSFFFVCFVFEEPSRWPNSLAKITPRLWFVEKACDKYNESAHPGNIRLQSEKPIKRIIMIVHSGCSQRLIQKLILVERADCTCRFPKTSTHISATPKRKNEQTPKPITYWSFHRSMLVEICIGHKILTEIWCIFFCAK